MGHPRSPRHLLRCAIFSKTPERSYFRLPPAGRYLSYVQPWSQTAAGAAAAVPTCKNIYVQAIDASGKPVGEARRLTIETTRDVANYFWKSSGHILFAKDFGGDKTFDEVSVGVDGSNEKDLTPLRRGWCRDRG